MEATAHEAGVKGAARWPSVRAAGSYFHHQDEQRLGPPSRPGEGSYFANDIVSADLVLRLPLYTGGRIANEFRAAGLLAEAAGHRLARTRRELVFNVTSTWHAILAQQKVVESAAFSRDVLTEHLARVESLIAARKAAPVDALRTEVRLANLEQNLLQERNIHAIQHRLLANLMGLEGSAGRHLELAGELVPCDDAGADDIETAIARAFRQRRDYDAARAEVEAQARRVDVARGERAPEVALEGAYGGRWAIGGSGEPTSSGSKAVGLDARGNTTLVLTRPVAGGGSLASTWGPEGLVSQRYTRPDASAADSFEDVGRIGVTVALPVFEGGRIRNQTDRERARLRAARQRLRKLELQIRFDVEAAMLNVDSSRARVRIMQKSIVEAEESLRIEREKYDYGKGAIVDVLDAQAALLNAQTSYYRALADLHTALAQLRLALGDDDS